MRFNDVNWNVWAIRYDENDTILSHERIAYISHNGPSLAKISHEMSYDEAIDLIDRLQGEDEVSVCYYCRPS